MNKKTPRNLWGIFLLDMMFKQFLDSHFLL
jgi:hypothetical protein